jgi:hypothetical protein
MKLQTKHLFIILTLLTIASGFMYSITDNGLWTIGIVLFGGYVIGSALIYSFMLLATVLKTFIQWVKSLL